MKNKQYNSVRLRRAGTLQKYGIEKWFSEDFNSLKKRVKYIRIMISVLYISIIFLSAIVLYWIVPQLMFKSKDLIAGL